MFSRIPLCGAKDASEDSLKLPLAEHMGCICGPGPQRMAIHAGRRARAVICAIGIVNTGISGHLLRISEILPRISGHVFVAD
ncbi:hypothetical protein A2U01_0062527, partial [Trifolium medium]|nr:hypothetical protein [Trifolium medium]